MVAGQVGTLSDSAVRDPPPAGQLSKRSGQCCRFGSRSGSIAAPSGVLREGSLPVGGADSAGPKQVRQVATTRIGVTHYVTGLRRALRYVPAS